MRTKNSMNYALYRPFTVQYNWKLLKQFLLHKIARSKQMSAETKTSLSLTIVEKGGTKSLFGIKVRTTGLHLMSISYVATSRAQVKRCFLCHQSE